MKLKCGTCKRKKFTKYFSKENKTKRGYQRNCKTCCQKNKKFWWNLKTKIQKVKYIFVHNLQRSYGLTTVEYSKLLKSQNGVCAICKKKETRKKIKRLAVDHNHETGKIRGLLCNNCNNGLGRFGDDPKILKSAVKYLERNRS